MMDKTGDGKAFLYERIAREIAEMAENGTFHTGDRIPSVRETSRLKKVSVTTVLEAYRLLEDRGLIEVRPQSGYYIAAKSSGGLPEPEEASAQDPSPVTVQSMVMQVHKDALDPALVQFGAALPNPDLLPTAKLGRILAGLAKRNDYRQNVCGSPVGCEELRLQIAKHLVSSGTRVSPDEIIITAGCLEAVSLSLRAVCSPGDTVAVEAPSYFGVLHALESQGLKALEIPTHPVTGLSLDALRFAAEHRRISACFVMTNFSNPLGSLMPDENKEQLAEFLASKGIPLIEDDIHGELGFSEPRPSTAKAFDRSGGVLLCSSFSKDLSPSYRIGWVVPGRRFQDVEKLKMATNVCTPILAQLAIAEFLENGGYARHLRKIRRAYAEKTSRMAQTVLRSFPEGSRVSSPQGGFVLWVRLPEEVDSLVLYHKALGQGITLVPGYLFSAGDKYRNFIRLNAAYWSEKTDEAVRKLGGLAKSLASA